MMGLALSRRARIGLVSVFLLALLVLFPLRLALGLFGMDNLGLSARAVGGSLWFGRIKQLTVGDIALGSVDAGLSPLSLLVGRARLGVRRDAGKPDDLRGAMTAGLGRIGVDDVAGVLPLGAAAAPLPISSIDLTRVSVRFSGGACAAAEGLARARVAGEINGLNLSQGLSGAVRCEGAALLFPLVSQSGMEKLNVRLSVDGRYVAEMRVTTSDSSLAQSLEAQGFERSGDAFAIKITGAL